MDAFAGTLSIAPADPCGDEGRALVAELDAYLLQLYPGWALLTPVEVLAASGAWFLMARDGEGPLGCAALLPFDGYGELKRMYVRPEARGRRVGLALLRAVEAEARAMGLPRLMLETGAPQVEAVALYRREGFVERGRFGDYPSCGGSLFMEKRLG